MCFISTENVTIYYTKMLIKVSAVLDRFKRTVSVSLLLFLLLYSNCICFALNGDLDSTDGDQNSMMKTDPNIRIIPNGQGYGKNIPTPNDQLKDKKSGRKNKS